MDKDETPDATTKFLLDNIAIIEKNEIPKDKEGREAYSLKFTINNEENLIKALSAFEKNTKYTGKLTIESDIFQDKHGLQIAKIIKNNKLTSLTIGNRNRPFHDRVGVNIGDALKDNTSLTELFIYLDIGEITPLHLLQFFENTQSKLKNLGHMKVTKKLFENFIIYLNKNNSIKRLFFYYEPLKEVNLLYKKEIPDEVLNNLSNKIENDSNLIEIFVSPLEEKYQEDINEKLTNDINVINKTLQFSCDIVKDVIQSESLINEDFERERKMLENMVETVELEEKEESDDEEVEAIPVRSYLDEHIGESLIQALYNLDLQRKRYPDEKDKFFSVKGSIKFVAQYLVNNNTSTNKDKDKD